MHMSLPCGDCKVPCSRTQTSNRCCEAHTRLECWRLTLACASNSRRVSASTSSLSDQVRDAHMHTATVSAPQLSASEPGMAGGGRSRSLAYAATSMSRPSSSPLSSPPPSCLAPRNSARSKSPCNHASPPATQNVMGAGAASAGAASYISSSPHRAALSPESQMLPEQKEVHSRAAYDDEVGDLGLMEVVHDLSFFDAAPADHLAHAVTRCLPPVLFTCLCAPVHCARDALCKHGRHFRLRGLTRARTHARTQALWHHPHAQP